MGATTRVQVRVSPGARRAEIVGRLGDSWKVRVPAAPEGGRANRAVVRLLATTLELAPHDVTLVSGHAARDKVVALGFYSGSSISTGRAFASEWVMVFTVKNGKVTEFKEFTDSAQLNAAFD